MALPTVEAQGFSRLPSLRSGSLPVFLLCNGYSGEVLIKFAENSQDVRVLVNEGVAGQLGRDMGLPCPAPMVVFVSEKFLELNRARLPEAYRDQVQPGLHLGLAGVSGTYDNPPQSLILQATNVTDIAGTIVFDVWCRNHDRNNPGNFLIQGTGTSSIRFIPIDQGYCFGQPQWDVTITQTVSDIQPQACFMPEMCQRIESFDDFQPWLERVAFIATTAHELEDAVNSVPGQWGISLPERNALVEFLKQRAPQVGDLLRAHRDHFPNWKDHP